LSPAGRHADAASFSGFLQTPTNPAPDAGPLVESDQISAVVSRCINVIAEDAASIPLKLFKVVGKRMPVEVHDHPAIDLWRHINPVETQVVYMQQLFADLLVEGNHFGWLDIQNGLPVNMIRLPPESVSVIPHRTKIIAGYEWSTPDGKKETYPLEEIVHVRTRNPASIYRGMGFLPRLREQIVFDRSLRQYKLSQVRNGIPTTIVFNMKRGFGSDDEFERFQDEFWQKQRGVQNAGKPMFLREGDITMQVIPRPTENETAILQNLKYTRNEIAMLFGVPPARLSDYSEAFRANASEQGRSFIQDTIMNWHRLFIDYMNSTFLPRYFPAESKRLRFAYDYSQVRALALSTRDMATVNEIAIRNGMRTPNQGAVAIGDAVHDDPAADKLYMNGKPLGQKEPQQQPAKPEKPGNQPGETDPQNDDDGKEPDEAQNEDARILRVLTRKGDDVDLEEMWIASAVFSRAADDGDSRKVFGVASTGSVDRANTIVNQKSLAKAAAQFKKNNGKIFYNHQWQIPIGRAIEVETREDKLMLAAEIGRDYSILVGDGGFGSASLYPVNDIWKQIEQKNLSSYSVAFSADEKRGEKESDPIELLVKQLFEISVVSIPANPDAEFTVAKAASDNLFAKMLRGDSRPTPRGDEGRGLEPTTDDGVRFALDEGDDELSRIAEECDRWQRTLTTS